jgi:hypothetical protein
MFRIIRSIRWNSTAKVPNGTIRSIPNKKDLPRTDTLGTPGTTSTPSTFNRNTPSTRSTPSTNSKPVKKPLKTKRLEISSKIHVNDWHTKKSQIEKWLSKYRVELVVDRGFKVDDFGCKMTSVERKGKVIYTFGPLPLKK